MFKAAYTRRDLAYFIASIGIANAIIYLANFKDNWEYNFGVLSLSVAWVAFMVACTLHAKLKGLHPLIGFILSLFSMVGLIVLILWPGKKTIKQPVFSKPPINWVDIGYASISEVAGWGLCVRGGVVSFIGFLLALYGLISLAWLGLGQINSEHRRGLYLAVMFFAAYLQAAVVAALLKT